MKTHKILHLSLGLALLTPALADDTPAAPPKRNQVEKGQGYHKLKLSDTKGSHLLTVVGVEDRKAAFLVDSGASQEIVVTEKLAKSLGKTLENAGEVQGITGKGKLYSTSFDKINIGGAIVLKNKKVIASPIPLEKDFGTEELPFGGLLGSQFLYLSRAIVSYSENTFFIPTNKIPSSLQRQSCLSKGGWALPLHRSPQGLPFLYLNINGKDYSFLMDTGAGSDIIDAKLATELKAELRDSNHKVRGGTLGQLDKLQIARLQNVTFADNFILPQAEFLAMPRTVELSLPEGAPPYGGIIGAPFLKASGAVVDFGTGSILLSSMSQPEAIRKLISNVSAEASDEQLDAAVKQTQELQQALKKERSAPKTSRRFDLRGLNAESTDEEIQKALEKGGHPTTATFIKMIRKQLQSLNDNKGNAVGLSFQPGSTREEIRETMRKAGVPVNEKQVERVFKTLQASKAAKPLELTVPEGTHKLAMTLEPSGKNYWTVKSSINGKEAILMLDTGAQSTVLDSGSLSKLGLEAGKDSLAFSRGAGGLANLNTVTTETFQLGKATANKQEFRSTNLHNNGFDALLGGDYFSQIHAVMDLSSNELYYNKNRKIELAEITQRSDLKPHPLHIAKNHITIDVLINGKPAHLLLDTGASSTIIYSDAAERLGLDSLKVDGRVRGAGGINQASIGVHSIDQMQIGAATVDSIPALIGDIGKVKNEKVDGILGADALLSFKPILDYGSQQLFIPAGEYDMHLYTKTGTKLLGSDEELAKAYADGTFIGFGKIKQVELFKPGQKKSGTPDGMRALNFTYTILKVINGDKDLLNKEVKLHYYLPEDASLDQDLARYISRNSTPLLIGLPDKAENRMPLKNAIWIPGSLAGKQLKRLNKQ
ncbi:clan AA aspartic protease, TIGR02281 family [Rubritalea squalenifaciens DSM 18772]|uniref:Clan AA aspartic protease, TIGR02281 family n=1 Tax=Rubritalea squalenifaciens DSM 18772 TaxID=1123071 RepID=A0A1M6QF77_9BACT|nr:aspartyl protease family protein [Rubritalea squalenifaciens]SHK18919.1 clan AA aspartic protease, TIGR02281 family [Rubritalea squalenifaciens DSM 18772]